MATDTTGTSANGLYGGQYGQPAELAATTPSVPSHTPSMSQSTATSATTQKADPREIGWYFVEQYYTTLSKSPEKIHLFYSKKSQLVTGVEAEKVLPAFGTKAISEKIKALDIQDCKVRVLNVDSQASFQNIVVQVIGEMSNKSEPHHKFVQTFVLAEQPNGYFVLNDIFRFLNDDEDEIVDDEPPQAEVPAEEPGTPVHPANTIQPAHETVDTEATAEIVDEKLEEEEKKEGDDDDEDDEEEEEEEEETKNASEPASAEINGAEDSVAAEESPAAPESSESTKEVMEDSPSESLPSAESSTVEPSQNASAKAAAPPTADPPAAKRTWASMLSKAPAVPALPANPSSTAPTKTPRVVQQQQAPKAPAAPSQTADSGATNSPPTGQSNGWQTADHGKKTKGAQTKGAAEGVVLAYIKNVTEKVDPTALREVLESFGELKYYDVSRQRNCAFVEFADPTAYAAAVAANPHTVGSEQIYVEERRPRANAYGGSNATFGRGNGNVGRGRGNMQGRTGSHGGFPKDLNRGGFQQRGNKSGNVTPKGRGQGPAS